MLNLENLVGGALGGGKGFPHVRERVFHDLRYL